MHQTKIHRVQGTGMEDFGILWIWGFCGDSHEFFCGYGMGMGIKIQFPRQPGRPGVGGDGVGGVTAGRDNQGLCSF